MNFSFLLPDRWPSPSFGRYLHFFCNLRASFVEGPSSLHNRGLQPAPLFFLSFFFFISVQHAFRIPWWMFGPINVSSLLFFLFIEPSQFSFSFSGVHAAKRWNFLKKVFCFQFIDCFSLLPPIAGFVKGVRTQRYAPSIFLQQKTSVPIMASLLVVDRLVLSAPSRKVAPPCFD